MEFICFIYGILPKPRDNKEAYLIEQLKGSNGKKILAGNSWMGKYVDKKCLEILKLSNKLKKLKLKWDNMNTYWIHKNKNVGKSNCWQEL